jgi:hypothetical protein
MVTDSACFTILGRQRRGKAERPNSPRQPTNAGGVVLASDDVARGTVNHKVVASRLQSARLFTGSGDNQ